MSHMYYTCVRLLKLSEIGLSTLVCYGDSGGECGNPTLCHGWVSQILILVSCHVDIESRSLMSMGCH